MEAMISNNDVLANDAPELTTFEVDKYLGSDAWCIVDRASRRRWAVSTWKTGGVARAVGDFLGAMVVEALRLEIVGGHARFE